MYLQKMVKVLNAVQMARRQQAMLDIRNVGLLTLLEMLSMDLAGDLAWTSSEAWWLSVLSVALDMQNRWAMKHILQMINIHTSNS